MRNVGLQWLGLAAAVVVGATSMIACGSESSTFEPDKEDPIEPPTSSSGNPGLVTDPDAGSSSSSSSGALPTCATGGAATQRKPLYINIVLDGSGSMDGMKPTRTPQGAPACTPANPSSFPGCEQCTPSNTACWTTGSREEDPREPGRMTGKRWLAAREALKAYFDARAAEERNDLAVGMFAFAMTPYSAPIDVARIDAAHADLLWSAIAPGYWPDGLTPTNSAYRQELQTLRNFSPSAPLLPDGNRAMVLITDGVPYGGSGDSTQTRGNVEAAVREARAHSESVLTAVIGVGNPDDDVETYDETFLSGLANLGGVAAAGCNPSWSSTGSGQPCHIQVTPGVKTADQIQAEIAAAIEKVALQVASCELAIQSTDPIDPEKVNVLYTDGAGNQSQVQKGEPNGWSYDDPINPTKVILHGNSCERLKNNPDGRVDIVIGCPTGTTIIN